MGTEMNRRSAGARLRFMGVRVNPFLLENGKLIARFIFTLFFFGIGIWFLKHERVEIVDVRHTLRMSDWRWIVGGIGMTLVYILLQGQMYVYSFASVHTRISLPDATALFIKRNLISVFLPAGGLSSLVFFSGPLERKGVGKSRIHFASTIYAFTGLVTVVIVAIPVLVYSIFKGAIGSGGFYGLAFLAVLITGCFLLFRSVFTRGRAYRLLVRLVPGSEVFLDDFLDHTIDRKKVWLTVLVSMAIEFTGITHLYIAMAALHLHPSLFAAFLGYIISVIFLLVSPFLRGLGAIEVSMTYVLVRLGFGHVQAISVTLLYRFFEFWLPLVAGVLTFLSRVNKLLMRILPAVFLMILGILDIVSVLRPAVPERLNLIREFLPMSVINASGYLVAAAGLLLMVTAAFMLKGLRTAWLIALILSGLSLVGHLGKAIDYEEAIVALVVIAVLATTAREYYIRSDPKLRAVGLRTALLLTLAILVYGTIGFYFLDRTYFNMDFSLFQSIRYTLQNYLLMGNGDLVPTASFARHFLRSINVSGMISLSILVFTLVRPYVVRSRVSEEEVSLAKGMVREFGTSQLDYFKTYRDKTVFLSENRRAFIGYRIAGNFAVVLENPVADSRRELADCIRQAEDHFMQNGLKSIYYRVPENSLPVFDDLHWKHILLGQEGLVDLSRFSLEGGERHSVRNAVKKVSRAGYTTRIHTPPVKDGILQKIRSVSEEWLHDTRRREITFSQGMFLWDELKQHTIMTVENDEEKVIAFLDLLPPYSEDETTYDLIRKSREAPNGIMDFMLVELFNYAKSLNYRYVNIGFAPLSGLDEARSFPERSMKFAYEKINSFAHYKGMREYKDKFVTEWQNRYLVYQHDYDLIQIPRALARVFRPFATST